MILRRLADNIRRQNWFTVAVELIVVVVGIFVAVQVDRLYEGRRQAELSRAYAARLLVDIRSDIDRLRNALDLVDRKAAALEQVQQILSGAETHLDSGSLAEVIRISQAFGWVHPLNSLTAATFNEMISSGSLVILEDPALRAELLGYYDRLDLQKQRLDERRTEFPKLIQRLAPPRIVSLRLTPSASDLAEATDGLDVSEIVATLRAGGLADYVGAELTYAFVLEQQLLSQLDLAASLERSLELYAGDTE